MDAAVETGVVHVPELDGERDPVVNGGMPFLLGGGQGRPRTEFLGLHRVRQVEERRGLRD